jgi:hypothetical protein
MTQPNMTKIDQLAVRFANDAMAVLIKHPRIGEASHDLLDQSLAAMRAAKTPALDAFLADAKAVPHMAEAAYMVAVLEVAEAGLAVINAHFQMV